MKNPKEEMDAFNRPIFHFFKLRARISISLARGSAIETLLNIFLLLLCTCRLYYAPHLG